MTLIAGGVSVAQLAKSKSSGDFIAGIVASVVLTGGMGIVAALLRRLGKRLRAKKL